ncbi:neuferricin-like [Oppia nitens]|uniref:neuferricin-like n=1 Tax=Oppia nitens TaxID=1686743 RepID=UPI0023D99272|nr:neuferricin-like [Oppia nitens]
MSSFSLKAIIIAITSAIILVLYPNILNYNFNLLNNFLVAKDTDELVVGNSVAKNCLEMDEILLTPDELARYDGSSDSRGLYLAFLGIVYDVSSGSQHYKPGGSYAFFAGKDATRAYITGDFSQAGLSDDLTSGVDVQSFDGIRTWIDLYEKDYRRVGRLVGRYYDQFGCPTDARQWVSQQIHRSDQLKEQEQDLLLVFPLCNSEWSGQTNSGRVWCSRQSGGYDRQWIGVPRQLFMTDKKQYRCACVRDSGPPTEPAIVYEEEEDSSSSVVANNDHNQNVGDLNNPLLKSYDGCDPKSSECKISD